MTSRVGAPPDAVVLCGGLGTRVASILGRTPKVLAPVGRRPFLDILLARLRAAGVRRVVLALGRGAGAVRRHLAGRRPRGIEVCVSVERRPLGTGGALRRALRRVRTPTLLAVNGDSWADAPLGDLRRLHRDRRAAATLVVTRVRNAGRYGRVDVARDGRVMRFTEKGRNGPGDVYAGLCLFERSSLEGVPPGRLVSLEREILPRLLGRGLYALRGRFGFIDIGTPESLHRAASFFRVRSR